MPSGTFHTTLGIGRILSYDFEGSKAFYQTQDQTLPHLIGGGTFGYKEALGEYFWKA